MRVPAWGLFVAQGVSRLGDDAVASRVLLHQYAFLCILTLEERRNEVLR